MKTTRLVLVLSALVGALMVPTASSQMRLHSRRTPAPPVVRPDLLPCTDPVREPGCGSARRVFVDYDRLGIDGRSGGEWLSYDLDEMIGPVPRRQLALESELSVAVRLILSEVGPERLVESRYGLTEAVGILYTVSNRLDPLVANPQAIPDAPVFPGCGADGDFISCSEPQQYLGLLTRRALDPQGAFDPAVLPAAVDLSVMAWFLHDQRLVPDPTDGATNYVHRCGGTAYGMTTHHCDGHMGRRWGDVPGAEPHTGPIVFYAPTVFDPRRGVYILRVSRFIDYVVEGDPQRPSDEELRELDVPRAIRPW